MITRAIHTKRAISFRPTKNLKILKKLFNIISPSIKYAKKCLFVLDKSLNI